MILQGWRKARKEENCDAPRRSDAGRQISAHRRPGLHHRGADSAPGGDGPAPAGPCGGPEHGRIHLRLSRLAPGRARPAGAPRRQAPEGGRDRLQGGAERGPGRDGRLGQPAGQPVRGRALRRRLRHVVRQGPGRGPHGRRLQARQLRRRLAQGRGAGGGRRRPLVQVVDPAVAVGIRLPGLRDAGALAGRRAGGAGLRSAGLCAQPLLGPVGGADRPGRHHGFRRDDRRQPGPSPVRHA